MVWVALSGLSPHRKVSIPGGALTYQHRGCSWEKATSDQPLLIEAVNSSEVFLPQKHKAVGSGKVEKGLTGLQGRSEFSRTIRK